MNNNIPSHADKTVVTPRYISALYDYLSTIPSWMHHAACHGYHGDMQRIIDICPSCPVQQECLHYAHEHGVSTGVWGGEILG